MMILFRLLPLWGKAAAVLAVLAMIGGTYAIWHHKVYQSGYDAAVADVAHQNQEAVDAVNKRRAIVRACDAADGLRWDQVARQCVRRD